MGIAIIVALAAAAFLSRGKKKPTVGPGFGQQPFVAEATPQLPVKVTGCSFARIRLGNREMFVDANTGTEITQAEASRRKAAESCDSPELDKPLAPISSPAPAPKPAPVLTLTQKPASAKLSPPVIAAPTKTPAVVFLGPRKQEA